MSDDVGIYYHRKAIDSIVYATKLADEGRHSEAVEHVRNARTWIGARVQDLQAQGLHKQARSYEEAAMRHVERVEGRLKNVAKAEREPTFKPTSPKRDKRYNYVPLHELHPEDQASAHNKFMGREMHSYHYPVDNAGRLAHAARWPAPPAATPAGYPELKPERQPVFEPAHPVGSAVDIHPAAGAPRGFGVVEHPSPYHPDKVAVRYGPAAHEVAHVESGHLRARSLAGRAKAASSEIRGKLKELKGAA